METVIILRKVDGNSMLTFKGINKIESVDFSSLILSVGRYLRNAGRI